MSDLVHVQFCGDDLRAVRDGDDVWVVVRPVCEALRLATDAQRNKLKTKPWATTSMNDVVAEDGRIRELFCIHIDSLPMWLATIEPSRVGAEVRPKLEAYQTRCAQVLRDYFFGRPSARGLEARISSVESAVATIAEAVHVLAEQQAAANQNMSALVALVREQNDERRQLTMGSAGQAGRRYILSALKAYGEAMGGGDKASRE